MKKVRLPVVGTTAPDTEFVSAELVGPDGVSLFFDGNSKITRGNGTFEDPKPNAFSIENIADCPGSTPTCRSSCFVHGIKKHAADTFTLYERNSQAIKMILGSSYRPTWAMLVAEWILEHARGGFRWHVSGDVFSGDYAEWIACVVSWSAPVEQWIYTRSFEHVEPLLGHENLAVNLSVDRDNYARGVATRKRILDVYGQALRLCYLATSVEDVPRDLPADSVIFPDYPVRPRADAQPTASPFWRALWPRERKMVCPVDAWGKSEERRCGPCGRCLT